MQRPDWRVSRLGFFVVALVFVSACGGGGAASGEDTAPPLDVLDVAGDGVAADTGAPDGGGATPCEHDDDCAGVFESLGACELPVCDTVPGICVVGRRPDKAPCEDDDPCTVGTECLEGVCGAGVDYDCDDGDPCSRDVCDGEGGCEHPPAPAGTSCDDGNACTDDDVCDAHGVCAGVDGAACACTIDADCEASDDGNACNGVLACEGGRCVVAEGSVVRCDTSGDTLCARTRCVPETGGCAVQPLADGTSCDDDDPCTTGDVCVSGACSGAAGACPCAEDGDCAGFEDGDACNGTLVCRTDACVVDPETRVECDDPTPADCLVPTCDPTTGGCVEERAPGGRACEDGDACTSGATCDDGGACRGGTAISCDDGNVCTDDACDSETGCTHTPNTVDCDDGNACTEGDRCAAGQCTAGTSVDCDDGNPCTEDSCNAETGCVRLPLSDVPCDDGDACTGGPALADHCVDGVCVGGEPCTCQSDGDCADREDGDLCNGTLRCTNEQCVVDPATVVTCPVDQDTDCRRNTCQPGTGACSLQAVGDGDLCDDGDPCTTADTCQAGSCTAGAPLSCDDSDDCTEDACVDGACQNAPIPGCGGACTSDEHCDDGNSCTRDACGPGGQCTFEQLGNGAACEDGDPCSGGDQCQGGSCTSGALNLCGGSCNPAATLACGDTVEAATWDFASTAFMDTYACSGATFDGPEMAYVFVAQDSLRATATLDDAAGLGLLVLRAGDGGCDPLRCVAGDRSGGPVSWSVAAGETWFVVVDGENFASNAFTLTLTCDSGEDCDNGVDDDDDGATDCDDSECATSTVCREGECTGGVDDDGDGATDCDDIDCVAEAACLPEPDCSNGIDDDSDGATDCADTDCAAAPTCLPEVACSNGVDDDSDGATDCADSDCFGVPACVESDCSDFVDNDGDGATDCADGDCDGQVGCVESLCGNGLDDDRDGATDCRDADCDGNPACVEMLCDDNLDNDRDDRVDCDDPDCYEEWPCSALCRPQVQLRCGDVIHSRTSGAESSFEDYGDCLPTRALGGPEHVWAFLPDHAGMVTVTLFDADFDAALLRLNDVCRPPEACGSGVDAGGEGANEVLRFFGSPGVPYFVVVDGVDGDEGDYSLAVGCSYQPERVCDNGVDEDGDGMVDCSDADCRYVPPCVESDCSNGVDDNGNGLVDCLDATCAGEPACGEFDCANATDDDGDGDTDCDDDECRRHPACGERCDNGQDDDDDGATDCVDPDCAGSPDCVEDCDNGLDDEGDGLTDCADPECVGTPGCYEASCVNLQDDDGDGATDCLDLDCVGVAACRETACSGLVDDDGDGRTDCDDPDCVTSEACAEVSCGNGTDDDDDGFADCADSDCRDAAACAGEVCRPSRPLGCGGTLSVDLRDPAGTDVFDEWPTCDLFGFDHSGPELAFDLPIPCTGIFTVTVTPGAASGGFFNVLLLDGERGCGDGGCRDISYGTQDGVTLTLEALEGEHYTVVVDALDGYAGPFDIGLACTCTPLTETVCDDGLDQDSDLATDCADADCATHPLCAEDCLPRGSVTCGETVGGTLGSAAGTDRVDAWPTCDRAGFEYGGTEDTWAFTSPCTGPVTVTTIRTAGVGTMDTMVVREDALGRCGDPTCTAVGYMGAGGVGQVAFGAIEGARYYLVVDAAVGTTASYTITATCGCLGETNCGDTIDNDGDGATDCVDSDCASTPACSTSGQCTAIATLTCDEEVLGDTSSFSPDRVDLWSCSDLAETGPEDVYRWVAPSTGLVSAFLDIQGGFDLDLFVLEDLGRGCDPGACVAARTTTSDERVAFLAVAGRTYYIVVDGFQEASGPYRLVVDCSPGCDLGGEATCLAPVDGDLAGATATDAIGAYTCDVDHDDYSGAEMIYEFDAPCTGSVDVKVRKLFDGAGAVDLVWLPPSPVCDGACVRIEKMDAATGIASMTLDIDEGDRLLFAVDGRDGAVGPFQLQFDCAACLSDDPCYGSRATWCGATVSGTTDGEEDTFSFYGCSSVGWPGGDTWRLFEPTVSGPVTLSLATDGDLGVFVIEEVDGACDAFSCTAGPELLPLTSELTFDAVVGRRYYIVVDGWTEAGAPFALDVDCP